MFLPVACKTILIFNAPVFKNSVNWCTISSKCELYMICDKCFRYYNRITQLNAPTSSRELLSEARQSRY